jgi:hypothetical protein
MICFLECASFDTCAAIWKSCNVLGTSVGLLIQVRLSMSADLNLPEFYDPKDYFSSVLRCVGPFPQLHESGPNFHDIISNTAWNEDRKRPPFHTLALTEQ